jgi:hypothetical protein
MPFCVGNPLQVTVHIIVVRYASTRTDDWLPGSTSTATP